MNDYKFEIWDKTKDINGVSPEEILASLNYDVKYGYTIFVNDTLLFFQCHKPNIEGYQPMTKAEAEAFALAHIEQLKKEELGGYING